MKKYSISPVYNREKFLLRFIKSIQHQNFFDIEIIFVDDNSSDNSAKVIKKYMKKDKRILLNILVPKSYKNSYFSSQY